MSETGVAIDEAASAALLGAVGVSGFRVDSTGPMARVYVDGGCLIGALGGLRDRAGYSMLAELGATDYLGYPGREVGRGRFEVHYVLLDLDRSVRLVLKVEVSEDRPELPTATSLWKGADWMEREVWDMYGIRFVGHSDLRRILMPEEFTAYPLRKDYPLRGRGERHNFPKLERASS